MTYVVLDGANGNGMAKYEGNCSLVLYRNGNGMQAVRRSGPSHTFKATFFTDFLQERGASVLLCAYNINDLFYQRCNRFASEHRDDTNADISALLK